MQNKIIALYKFVSLPNYRELKNPILKFCQNQNIKGTLLLASEGINGTVAGKPAQIDALLDYLKKIPAFSDIEVKVSYAAEMPFHRTKVKLKKEIVSFGDPDLDPRKEVGEYVDAEKWNPLIADPETIVIDTRNDYEVQLGKFKGAMNPNTKTFRELSDFVAENLEDKKDKKIAMYCTGGIRCEKSTAYLLKLGFKNVYHLKGGILKYLEEIPQKDSLWDGDCFVFDERVTVDHNLAPGNYELCHACRHPISEDDKHSPKFSPSVSCPHCYDLQTPENKARASERHKQITLAKARNEKHIGAVYEKDQKTV